MDFGVSARFADEAGLDEGEALSFLFENFDSVINEDTFTAPKIRDFQFRVGRTQEINRSCPMTSTWMTDEHKMLAEMAA